MCVCVKDNPKNKGKDMLQQWSMAKKTIWIYVYLCVCVKDNPKNKGKDMLQQWSMAKKTLEGGLAELAQVIATKKMENKKVRIINC